MGSLTKAKKEGYLHRLKWPMMKLLNLPLLLILILLHACGTTKQETASEQESDRLDHAAIAELLMQRMDLQAGEQVLLVGEPGQFDELVRELSERISASKATYLGCISTGDTQPEGWTTEFVTAALALESTALQDHLSKADIGIMLPGPTPYDTVYALIQGNLWEGKGRTIHFHWSGAYDVNGNALDITPEMDAFYQDVILTTDYEQLAADQQQFEQSLHGDTVQVTTPAGTNVSFVIGDRPVTKQNGDASAATASLARNLIDREMEIPAGAIRVAPIEASVYGTVAFPDSRWYDQEVKGLVLTFEAGKVVDVQAEVGLEAVQKIMEEYGSPAQSFREFALGFNPKLAIPESEPWIPYYGYGSGIVRLSLGDNTELGGNVDGGYVRWNFFTDATVTIGEEAWVVDGKAVK